MAFGAIGGMFRGVTSLFRGPKSLGSPTKVQDPEEVTEAEAEATAIRGDIVRRNQLRTSSTAGTGADFIRRMQEGPAQLDKPIPELIKKDAPTGPQYTDTELAQREVWSGELSRLQSQGGGYTKSSLAKANLNRRNQRIGELNRLLGNA